MTIKFTDDHEWARTEDDLIVVGITDFAQKQLGELVYVELPEVDREIQQGEEAAVIESVKAAGEVKSPISGTIAAVNESLADSPEKINDDPAGDGWVYKIRPTDATQLDALMDESSYQSFIDSLG